MTVLQKSLIIFTILTATYASDAYASVEENRITIKKIKLEIDGEKYAWTDEMPESAGGSKLPPETIFSFTGLYPGMKTNKEKLNRETELFEARLRESGMFYSAEVAVVPPRNHSENRTITVRVTTGFLMRIGGGIAYGYIGNKSIAGNRTEWGLTAGVNTAGFSMIFHDAFNRNIYISPSVHYENHLLRGDIGPYHNLDISFDAGKYITPDILVGAGSEVDIKLPFETALPPGVECSLYGFALMKLPETNVLSGTLSVKTPLIFTGPEIIPSLLTTGMLVQEISIFRFQQAAGLHYLWGDRDASLPGTNIRTLPENTNFFCSAEAGITVLDEVFFSILRTKTELFCFGELGSVNDSPIYGTGAGIALKLNTPVFTTLELFINKNNTDAEWIQLRIKGDF